MLNEVFTMNPALEALLLMTPLVNIVHFSNNVNNLRLNFDKVAKNAEFEGKLLGLMIASNKIFENKTISFAGFSLGTKVVFNALSILKELSHEFPFINQKISHVIFMGGALSVED